MLDGKSLNLADLSAKLDEDDLANGKPKGDSVTYYRQMVDSLIESTSTRPEDRYIIFSQEGSQYFYGVFVPFYRQELILLNHSSQQHLQMKSGGLYVMLNPED